jgi:hypothetical protein
MAKKSRRRVSTKRNKDNYNSRNDGGSGGSGIINWGKFKKSPSWYKPKEGTNKLNVIPFEAKTKNHPAVKSGELEIGDLDIFLDLWVHRNVGPSEATVVCPKKNFNKFCPLCAENKRLYDDGDKDGAKAFRATRRSFFNVQPIIKGEVQDLEVWEVSHYNFTKLLVEEANECADGDDIINYADPEEGKVIKVRFGEESIGKTKYLQASRIDFLEREEEIDDDLIDQAISFDEGLVILSEEQIEKIMYGADEDEEDDDEKGKKSSENTSPYTEEEPDEDEDGETEEERRARIRKEKSTAAKKAKEEKEEDEEEEDKKSEKSSSNKKPDCFGKKCDKLDKCDKCGDWDDCMDEMGG